jgi:hypothetical protein
MKSGMQTEFFLASYGFKSIGLVLVKKRSVIRKKSSRIPDQGGKKAPDPDPQQ